MRHTPQQKSAALGKSDHHHDIVVRPLQEPDMAEAKRIFHLAFGTFLGLPDPMQFHPDRDFVISRWRANAAGGLAAECNGQLIGSNIASFWGSVGFFGPLTIHPDFWNQGVAGRLVESTMALFEKSASRSVGLFTFPHSTKHVHLYQKFGFWPRFLTPIMSLTVRQTPATAAPLTYSTLSEDQQREVLNACLELTNRIHDGLDVRSEIRAVADQDLGDTVLVWNQSHLVGLAICHCGAQTEAGKGTVYVKFAAARTAADFQSLLTACENFANARNVTRLEAGVNMARLDAYQRMIAHGFRSDFVGVAMHKANDPGYSRPDVYIMDDWR